MPSPQLQQETTTGIFPRKCHLQCRTQLRNNLPISPLPLLTRARRATTENETKHQQQVQLNPFKASKSISPCTNSKQNSLLNRISSRKWAKVRAQRIGWFHTPHGHVTRPGKAQRNTQRNAQRNARENKNNSYAPTALSCFPCTHRLEQGETVPTNSSTPQKMPRMPPPPARSPHHFRPSPTVLGRENSGKIRWPLLAIVRPVSPHRSPTQTAGLLSHQRTLVPSHFYFHPWRFHG